MESPLPINVILQFFKNDDDKIGADFDNPKQIN